MTERCDYCGRFMEHVWYQTGEHDDDWQDYWRCSRTAMHKIDNPGDYV